MDARRGERRASTCRPRASARSSTLAILACKTYPARCMNTHFKTAREPAVSTRVFSFPDAMPHTEASGIVSPTSTRRARACLTFTTPSFRLQSRATSSSSHASATREQPSNGYRLGSRTSERHLRRAALVNACELAVRHGWIRGRRSRRATAETTERRRERREGPGASLVDQSRGDVGVGLGERRRGGRRRWIELFGRLR